MAIQLSAYLSLRNNDFKQMIEHPASRLRKEDRSKLRPILEELDKLHDLSDMANDDTLAMGPNPSMPLVVVPIQRRVLERSRNRKRSGELYLEVHRILRENFVNPEVYERLLNAHEELSIEPYDEDFKKAFEYATELSHKRNNWLTSTGRVSGSKLKDYFCWSVEMKRKEGPSFYRNS